MVNCVILAGKTEKMLRGKKSKGIVDINGKPMVSYVIQALKDSGVVDRIVLVGDKTVYSSLNSKIENVINDKGSMIDNVKAGVNYFKDDPYVLITTCDIPLLTGTAVREFVIESLKSEVDLCYPVIKKKVCKEKYPNAKRTYVKLKEGHFTGGNMMIINPLILDKCIEIAEEIIQFRKNPLKMSKVLGLGLLIKLITGRLSIGNVEKRVENILGLKPKAIITQYAEIGNDVDKPEDLEMAKKYLKSIEN
ncbi:nucleotidyltransferase family protein [Thermohalobacter berrensis]|uniref:Molybdopterin-guanine dinucleotide biosynthesis protein A n=1 Tax=Thermohalobacter berrensis TaxID=99594 RepID=A0A419T0E4_9FIRM|nr:nucleotidyltransferase family protein [Thermohalobacter berrensis]RKD30916.1 molybdopterin-guanine dinucleotide biosynthesis protein A [Thermohalobacter berrensis]